MNPHDFMQGVLPEYDRAQECPVVTPRFWVANRYQSDTPMTAMTHYCIGLMKRDQGDSFARNNDSWTGGIALVCDDVGEVKDGTLIKQPRITPSYIMETKPGSEQWGYCFSSVLRDQHWMETMIESIIAAGICDPGAKQAIRLVRLPGSDPKRRGVLSKLTHWEPQRRFDPMKLLGDMGVRVVPAFARTPPRKQPVVGAVVKDPLMDWMMDHEMVLKGPNATGFYDVLCPFRHLHPSRANEGCAYKPCTNDDAVRRFTCLHGTCKGRRFADYVAEMERRGAPFVAQAPAVLTDEAKAAMDLIAAQLKELGL